MEYCDGNDLDALMMEYYNTGRIITEYKAIKIINDVLSGLNFLHDPSPPTIIHRDIKGANVILNNGCWKLCDFGLSRTTDAHLESVRAFT